MLVFVVLAIFLAGLIMGADAGIPGEKIVLFDIQVWALAILIPIGIIMGFTALAATTQVDLKKGPANSGPHGFSEILYAFTSCIGNNGSAFAGLSGNTPWYNLTLGLATTHG